MTRIKLSDNGQTPFEKLIGHNEAVLTKWNDLENALFQNVSLNSSLLEQVRRTLAYGNECKYCMAKAGKPELTNDDMRQQVACAFAEVFAIDHKSVNDEHFRMLKEYFNDPEISELCSFISFITACQQLGHIYNLGIGTQLNK